MKLAHHAIAVCLLVASVMVTGFGEVATALFDIIQLPPMHRSSLRVQFQVRHFTSCRQTSKHVWNGSFSGQPPNYLVLGSWLFGPLFCLKHAPRRMQFSEQSWRSVQSIKYRHSISEMVPWSFLCCNNTIVRQMTFVA